MQSTSSDALFDTTSKPEFRITREFDAPRRLVFAAWSRAEYVSRWFTPAPLLTSECEVDFRPGGIFRVVMETPDGMRFPMNGRFIEIVQEEKIVFYAVIHEGLEVITTVTFSEAGGKTTLSAKQVYSRESDATQGAEAGWTQTLNQLAESVRNRM